MPTILHSFCDQLSLAWRRSDGASGLQLSNLDDLDNTDSGNGRKSKATSRTASETNRGRWLRSTMDIKQSRKSGQKMGSVKRSHCVSAWFLQGRISHRIKKRPLEAHRKSLPVNRLHVRSLGGIPTSKYNNNSTWTSVSYHLLFLSLRKRFLYAFSTSLQCSHQREILKPLSKSLKSSAISSRTYRSVQIDNFFKMRLDFSQAY